jgi:hypothetical protein
MAACKLCSLDLRTVGVAFVSDRAIARQFNVSAMSSGGTAGCNSCESRRTALPCSTRIARCASSAGN